MPKKGQTETSAPDVKLFGRGSKDPATGRGFKSKFEMVNTEGQTEQSAPNEAVVDESVGENQDLQQSGPAETEGGEQTNQRIWAGKFKSEEELEKAYLNSQTENLKLAQENADLRRTPAKPQELIKTPQQQLAEKLQQEPDFWENPMNQAQYTQQQIDQALGTVIPELEFKRHFEETARTELGKDVDFSKYDEPIQLPNGQRVSQYSVVRNYLQLLGRGKENPFMVLYAVDNAADLVNSLKKAETKGAVKAVKQVTQKASENQEKPGANLQGKRQTGTVLSETFRHGKDTGDFNPFIQTYLRQQGHSLFPSEEE